MQPAHLRIYKSLYRAKLRARLSRIEPLQREKKDRRIAGRICRSARFIKAKAVLVYMSFKTEVSTREIFARALAMRKKVFIPCIDRERHKMNIHLVVNPKRHLSRGEYGIQEPDRLACPEGKAQELELVLVPGLGFDKAGRRLGRGEGYFDSFLKGLKVQKIALAYREQILSILPAGPKDIPVDEVITD